MAPFLGQAGNPEACFPLIGLPLQNILHILFLTRKELAIYYFHAALTYPLHDGCFNTYICSAIFDQDTKIRSGCDSISKSFTEKERFDELSENVPILFPTPPDVILLLDLNFLFFNLKTFADFTIDCSLFLRSHQVR